MVLVEGTEYSGSANSKLVFFVLTKLVQLIAKLHYQLVYVTIEGNWRRNSRATS